MRYSPRRNRLTGRKRTELCFSYQYVSGCGAHHPASTTATPEIMIMSRPQTMTASHRIVGVPVMFFFSRILPLLKSIRPEHALQYSHTSSAGGVDENPRSVTSGLKVMQTNSAADASAAAAARSGSLSPVSASVRCARRSGIQGVAGRMLLEEKLCFGSFLVIPEHPVHYSTSTSDTFQSHTHLKEVKTGALEESHFITFIEIRFKLASQMQIETL